MKKKRGLILLLATLATVFTAGALSSCEGCGGCKPQSVIDYEEEHREPVDYTVTVTKNIQEAGTVTGAGTFEEEETIQLLATANAGYIFEGWYNMSGVKVSSEPLYSFVLEANVKLVANWVIDPVISETPTPADEVKVTLSNLNGVAGMVSGGNTYDQGANVTITATANEGYTFVGWYDENGVNVSSAATYTFTATQDVVYVARWQVSRYQIVTAKNIDGAGLVYGAATYDHGTTVSLYAVANAGYHFVGWFEGTTQVSTNEAYTFTATSDRTLTANWALNEYAVTVNSTIANAGTITGAGAYEHGDDVTLTATANAGYTFGGWYDDRGVCVEDGTTYTFVAQSNKQLTAVWTLNEYAITVTKNIENAGTITGAGAYDHGEQATLVATSATGYTFDGWYVGTEKKGETTTYAFAVTADTEITAKWTLNEYTVEVEKSHDGAGSVTGAGEYDHGEQVTLKATTNVGYTFLGWFDGVAKVSTNETYKFNAKTNKVLDAKWAVKNFTVAFDSDGGSTLPTQTVQEGQKATEPTAPTKAGYAFAGWYNGTTAFDFDTAVMENLTLKAQWTVNGYAISVDQNIAEAGSVTGAGSYNYGASVTLTATTSEGYTFDGWYVGATRVETNATYTFTATEDKALTAKWTKNTYVISVTKNMANAGTVTGENTYEHGASVTLTAMTNDGYNFDGWYVGTEKKSSETTYTFTATATVTVTAKWVTNKPEYVVTVTAGTEGGNVTGGGTIVEDENATVKATTNVGYTFDGWYVGTEKKSSDATYVFAVTEAVTVEARWTINSYTITATSEDDNKGTVTGAGSYNYGASVTLTATASEGYTFEGWYENGTKVAGAGATYTFTAEEDKTLVAKWTINTYTITVTSDDTAKGTVTGAGEYDHGEQVTLTATATTGYVFEGWYENGVKVENAGATYTFTASADKTLVAKWKVGTHTISVTKNIEEAGTVTGAGEYDDGARVTLRVTATNAGYEFLGWFVNGTSQSTASLYRFNASADVAVEARWKLAEYAVTVVKMPAAAGTVTGDGSYEYGTTATLTATNETGYVFDGWYVGETKVETATTYEFTVNAEVTVIAKWTLDTYTVTVEKNIAAAGSVAVEDNYEHGTSVTLIATTNDGYEFVGWYDGTTELATSVAYTFTITADTTLTAKWKLEEYEISVESTIAGAGTLTGAGTYENGEEVTLTATAATGYEFVGWYDGATPLSTNTTYTFTATATKTITAEWKLKEYTVTVNKNIDVAGSVTGADTYEHGDTVQLLATTNEHYTFLGWYVGSQEVETNLLYEFTVTADATVEAKWKINQYTVLIDNTNAVAGSISGSGPFDYGTTVTLVATPNVGYSLRGWYKGATSLSTETSYSFTLEGDVTIRALWEEKKFTVTFNSDGGNTVNSKTVQEGKTVAKPSDPTKEGYTFVGWFKEGSSTAWNFDTDVVMEDFELKAKWTVNNYVLTVEKNIDAAGTVTGGGTFTYGTEVTVTATSNAGYTWDGWYIGAELQSTDLEYTFTMGLDLTITAKWEGGMSGGEADTGDDEIETLVGQVAPAEPIYVIGKTNDMVVNVNSLPSFTYVSIDKLTVNEAYYTYANGLFTIKKDLLDTLALGQHVVRLHTDTGVCKFRVRVYKLATVVEGTNGDTSVVGNEVVYNQDNGSSSTFTMDFGGAPFVCVYINGNKVLRQDYTLNDTTITISNTFITENVADGMNELLIETAAGVGKCVFYCTSDHVIASFDKLTYKIQQYKGQSLTFDFDSKGREYEVKRVVDGAVIPADGSMYSVDPTARTLTIKSSYLDAMEADIYEFRVDVADEENSKLSFWVGAYGQDGKTIAFPGSTNTMTNFNSLNKGWACGQNTLTDEMFTGGATSVIVDAAGGAISGKSLKVKSSYGTEIGWNTMLGYNLNFIESQRYLIKVKMRIDKDPNDGDGGAAIIRFTDDKGAEVNGIIINVAASGANSVSQVSDTMTMYTYDEATGVFDISLYMAPNGSKQSLHFTAAYLGYCTFVFDEIKIFTVGETTSLFDYDFEDKVVGDGFMEYGLSTVGAVGEIINVDGGAISGQQSLKVTSTTDGAAAEWNTMLKSSYVLTASERYLFTAKFKYTLPAGLATGTIAFRLLGSDEVNGLLLNVANGAVSIGDATDSDTKVTYDASTGIVSVEVYMKATSGDQSFSITTVGLGTWTLILDDAKFERSIKMGIKQTFEETAVADYTPQMTSDLYTGAGATGDIIQTGAINGERSLHLKTSTAGELAMSNMMLQSDAVISKDTEYLLQFKMKYTMPSTIESGTILFYLVGSENVNALFLDVTPGNEPTIGALTEEGRSKVAYDASTGIITASVYMKATASNQRFNVTTLGGGVWEFIIDDFYFGTGVGFDIETGADLGSTTILRYDFDNATLGDYSTQMNPRFYTGVGASGTVINSGAINGKSLQVTSTTVGANAGWNVMLRSDMALAPGKTYLVQFKARITKPSDRTGTLAIRLVNDSGNVEGLYIDFPQSGNPSKGAASDEANGFTYNAGTGVYTITTYMTPTIAEQKLHITTIGPNGGTSGSGTWTLIVDDFELISDPVMDYTVTVTSENETMGTVTGSGTYHRGTDVTVVATPKEGYLFYGWYMDNTLVSTDATCTFKLTSDITAVAKFVDASTINTYTITATSEDENKGTVTGGGAFIEGYMATVVATPAEGYKFDGWYDGETKVSSATTYSFSATADKSLVAKFVEKAKFEVTVSSEDITMGTVTGSDTYTEGDSVTVVATPVDGYEFVGWYNESDVLVDSAASYTFVINGNVTLTAKFKEAPKTSPVDPISLIVADGFDGAGSSFTATEKLNAGSGFDASIFSEGAISGSKSLRLITNAAGSSATWNVALTSKFNAGYSRTYMVEMKFRVSTQATGTPQLWFRMVNSADEQVNGLVVNVLTHDVASVSDNRTTFAYDSASGLYTVNVVMTTNATGQVFNLTTVGGNIWAVEVDDFVVKGVPIMYETFESMTSFNPTDILNKGVGADASISTGEAIIGSKALQLVTNATGSSVDWNVMMSSKFGVQVGERYLFQMKYRYSMQIATGTICFRLVEDGGAEVNGLFLNVAGGAPSVGAVSEPGSTFFSYDEETGITTVGVYMTATSANQAFHLTTVGGGIWAIIVDEFAVTPA